MRTTGAQVLVIRGDISDNAVCVGIIKKTIDKFEGLVPLLIMQELPSFVITTTLMV